MKRASLEQELIQQHSCTWSVAHSALMQAKVELGYDYTIKMKSLRPDVRQSIVQAASEFIVVGTTNKSQQDHAESNSRFTDESSQVPLGVSRTLLAPNTPTSKRPVGLKFHSLLDPTTTTTAPIISGRKVAMTPRIQPCIRRRFS
ncbi:unnamed protein product [Cylindrotheca closterium]|uniref:Uncharacterized protein n=1 Tax=Cylindrotheca closterium TaxID=2856 RepID=A0AAD2PYA6_9STRA|nr:unnamed protein product [Cylindrotheca closterium]